MCLVCELPNINTDLNLNSKLDTIVSLLAQSEGVKKQVL